MRESIFTSFFIFLLAGICVGQASTDRERANLVGPVRVVRQASYRTTGTEEPKKPIANDEDTVTYDRNGNEIERVMVSDFGELMGKQTQSHNPDGSVREAAFVDSKGILREKKVFSYAGGKLLAVSEHGSDGALRFKAIRSYDANGILIEEAYSDGKSAVAKTVFRNDANGNAVEIAFFLQNGTKAIARVGPCLGAHRVTYDYDGKRRPIAKSVLEPDGEVKKSWTYVYDERGNLLKMTIKSAGSTATIDYKYEFDSFGNWVKSLQVYDSNDGMLDLMLSATGKKLSNEEMRRARDAAKITTVRTREISYY